MLTVEVQAWSAYYVRRGTSRSSRCTSSWVTIGSWRERERAHNSRPSHPFLPPACPLSDSVYICLSVWFRLSLVSSALPGPAEGRDWHVDLRALSQAVSRGNYLQLAGHLMRFTMIYAALCTENGIRDPRIGLLLINSTLYFYFGYVSILYWQQCNALHSLLYKEGN